MSPRKVRLVVDLVRGLDVAPALAQLRFLRKAAAMPVTKLIESAVANARHNFKLEPAKLYIKTITADGGPTMKRWRSRAFGRAAPIRKRSTHISVVLAERGAEAAKSLKSALLKPAKAAAPAKATPKATAKEAGKAAKAAPAPKAAKAPKIEKEKKEPTKPAREPRKAAKK